MTSYYSDISPDVDRARLAEAVRIITNSLVQNEGLSFVHIAREIQSALQPPQVISADAVRLFARAAPSGTRINSNNKTLAALYDYIVRESSHFGATTKRLYAEHLDAFGFGAGDPYLQYIADQGEDAAFALNLINWLHTSPGEITRLRTKIAGEFWLIRKSTMSTLAEPEFMISELLVRPELCKNTPYLSATHIHRDRSGRPRTSLGTFTPVVRNIYGVMRVEGYEGLEILVLRDPIQMMPQFYMGFMFGLNSGRNLYCSSVLLERNRGELGAVLKSARYRIRDVDLLPRVEKVDEAACERLRHVLSETSSRLIPRFDGLTERRIEAPGSNEQN